MPSKRREGVPSRFSYINSACPSIAFSIHCGSIPMYLCVTATELCCRDRRAGPPCLFRAIHFPRGAHRKGDASGRSGDRPLRRKRSSARVRAIHESPVRRPTADTTPHPSSGSRGIAGRHLPLKGKACGCVIASQCAHWRGNPFPLWPQGVADCHVASLLAMTSLEALTRYSEILP